MHLLPQGVVYYNISLFTTLFYRVLHRGFVLLSASLGAIHQMHEMTIVQHTQCVCVSWMPR